MARIVVLGATGFIGARTVFAALAAGHDVQAVARTSAGIVADLGARPMPGAAETAGSWMGLAAGADLLVDLTQPALPARVTGHVAAQRCAMTAAASPPSPSRSAAPSRRPASTPAWCTSATSSTAVGHGRC